MDIETVEGAFGELLAAAGDLVVARSRGAPADPAGGSTRALARRYRAQRRAFDVALDSLDDTRLVGEDARAAANMRGALDWLDELESTPGARPPAGGAGDETPEIRRLRVATLRRYGAAAAAIRVGPESLDRLTVLARLATEPDAGARRALFEAMAPVWRTVDGDGRDASPYRVLLRSSAARWHEHGSPIEANARSLGMPAGSIEGTLRAVLAAWRAVIGPTTTEPWDYRFAAGAAQRRLDPVVPVDRMLDVNQRYLTSLGADPARLGISYDVVPRPGRPPIPVAFTIAMGVRAGRPRPPWVFATYAVGGLGNLLELLHETGHAVHDAAIRTRPAFLDWTSDETAFLEGTADVLGWDATEPDWQRHWLGDAAPARDALLDRYGAVMLDVAWALFELELHRHPDRRPNDVWTELTSEGLGIEPHPDWSWWAIRGQLIDLPGYMANYALSAIVAAAVRRRTLEVRGSWLTGDPGWYPFMSERLFAPGASRSPADLLQTFLGEPLTVQPLLADLGRSEGGHP